MGTWLVIIVLACVLLVLVKVENRLSDRVAALERVNHVSQLDMTYALARIKRVEDKWRTP